MWLDMLYSRIDRCQYVVVKLIAELEDCCAPLLSAPIAEDEAVRMASALRVMADPARLRLVNLLAQRPESCVCDLTPVLGLTQPTVSHHLKVLYEAGLLDREQRGRWVYYRLRRGPLEALRNAFAP